MHRQIYCSTLIIHSVKYKPFNFILFQKITGHLFFIVLFIYAIVYAVERVTYIDSAWLFYQGVNYENFAFSWERFGAFFSELPLFIAVKLHLPFKALVYIFSLGFPLLYFIVWRICSYRLRNPAAGLVILFGMLMGVRETFLHTVTETHQVIVYSALFFALLEYEFKNPRVKIVLINAMLALVIFTHPFGVFTGGFVLLYYFFKTKNLKKILPSIILLLMLCAGMVIFLWNGNTGNSVEFSHIKDLSFSDSSGNNRAFDFIRMHFARFYWLPELAGLIAMIWLVLQKKWLIAGTFFISVAAYLVVAFIVFRNGDSSIMLERIFLPAFFMINLVFADELANAQQRNKWIPAVLVVFFMVNGIRYINTGCLMYKKRVAYLDRIVKEGIAGGHEFYFLSDKKTDKEKILVPWALGTETLIYSKFKYEKCISITMKDETCPTGSFHSKTETCQPVGEFNQRYFQLKGEAYVELK